MQRSIRFSLTGLAATAALLACEDSTMPRQLSEPEVGRPSFTLADGFTSTPVGRGNAGDVHIRSRANGYSVEIQAPNTDIVVANIVVAPKGNSGWHSHPGPVLVVVKTGAITFYRAGHHRAGHDGARHHGGDKDGHDQTCSHIVHPAGSAFIEGGGDVGMARNEGSTEATVTATYFVPAGAATRIDQPAPGGNCPS